MKAKYDLNISFVKQEFEFLLIKALLKHFYQIAFLPENCSGKKEGHILALIFGLAQMKVNCEQPVHNLCMQPAHQKKAL